MIFCRGDILNSKIAGYFSVEAALVFPMVMGTVLLLIYMAFYQYDRCMLEFDVALIALRGCSCDEEETGLVLDEMERAAVELSGEKYIIWEAENINIEVKGNRVRASGGGKLRFPFGFLLLKEANGVWKAEADYENRHLNPVALVRWYKKIGGE